MAASCAVLYGMPCLCTVLYGTTRPYREVHGVGEDAQVDEVGDGLHLLRRQLPVLHEARHEALAQRQWVVLTHVPATTGNTGSSFTKCVLL